jgi:hypothetical protein
MKYEQARELVEAALNEMATPRVAKKLKDYKSKSARQREAEKRYPLGHQKKGVSMRTDAVKKLRKLIDHHGSQAAIHNEKYNSSMNPEHRAQANAHREARDNAIDAHKALTGKEYIGTKPKKSRTYGSGAASYTKTEPKHYARNTAKGRTHHVDWHIMTPEQKAASGLNKYGQLP